MQQNRCSQLLGAGQQDPFQSPVTLGEHHGITTPIRWDIPSLKACIHYIGEV